MNTAQEKNKLNLNKETLKTLSEHPVVKVVIGGAIIIGVIYVSGVVMKIVASSVNSYKELTSALKK